MATAMATVTENKNGQTEDAAASRQAAAAVTMEIQTVLERAELSENKSRGSNGFEIKPLSEAQKLKMGIAEFYRPYSVDREVIEKKDKNHIFHIGKRVFDVFCSVLAILLLSPLILGFMAAIYIEDPKGSPIFKQQRIGKNGQPFTFYKLRSMCVDAEEKLQELLKYNELADGKAFKIKDDPRITKVGRIIRNTSIDELPQLVNILKGDMSIVGPRPSLPREVEQYDEYELQRLAVLPGLTCFWQVYPRRHEIAFEDWVAMDIKYIEQRSWKTDLKLVFQTFGVLLNGNHD